MRELTGRGRMGGRILLFLFLAFSLAFFPTADSSGGDSVIQWVQTNGPYGGVINTLVVHPSNPDIAYAGTFRWGTWPNTLGNGVFKTTDGGRTWHRANGADGILHGKPINSITLDPGDPEILYVLAFPTGIFKSSDGGGSWQKIFAKQNTIGFGLSESDTNILYAAALQGFNGPLIVYRSGDSGMTWRRAGSVPGTYDGCLHCLKNIVAVDPHNPDVVFVGTSEGIYKSRNGGQSWEAKSEGLTRRDMKSIVINPSNSQIVYALTGQEDLEGCFEGDRAQGNPSYCGGIYKSTDGGEHWQGAFIGLFDPWGQQLAFDPTDPNTIYAAISHRLYKSSDAGETWRLIYGIGPGFPKRRIGTDDNVASVAPFNHDIVYTGLFGGVIKSNNGGGTWQWATEGIDAHQIYSMAVDPTDPNVVYVGSLVGGGMYKTTDGGQSWKNIVRGFDNSYVMQIAIDPSNPQVVYATTTFGIYKTTNGGKSWQHLENLYFGRGWGAHTHLHGIAIDPSDSNVLYVGGGGDKLAPRGGGMFKSTDGGRTWAKINKGFTPDVHVSWVVIDPHDPQTLYVSTQGWTEEWERIGNGSGIFKSSDGGQTWKQVNNGIRLLEIGSLAIDPKNPQVLYAGDEEGNLYKTTDGAAHWQWLIKMAAEVGKIAVDRNNPDIVYAAVGKYIAYRGSLGAGVWRTTDGGRTWQPVNTGLGYKQVFNVEIDSTSSVLYAATGGGGVFRAALDAPSASPAADSTR